MILTCPCCGASASIEAWANDRDWRDLMTLVPAIPAQLQTKAISYLGLWRSGKRALKPAKAGQILKGLIDLVAAGTVHWDGGETRPAPVELWAKALDAVLERRPQALTNHNYLKHTAWEMAAGMAAQAESAESARKARPAARNEETGRDPVSRRKSCFTCSSFRPPKGCAAKSQPASGNEMLGCERWTQKTASAGGVMGDLLRTIENLRGDKEEG